MLTDKWLKRYLDLSEFISKWSKDPSSQTGAVIVDDNKNIVSHGYNGFPRNIPDSEEWLNNREIKYSLIIHAEINAILNSSRVDLSGCTMICVLYPCPLCASYIVQKNIKNVVSYQIYGPTGSSDFSVRWRKKLLLSQEIFRLGKVINREFKEGE